MSSEPAIFSFQVVMNDHLIPYDGRDIVGIATEITRNGQLFSRSLASAPLAVLPAHPCYRILGQAYETFDTTLGLLQHFCNLLNKAAVEQGETVYVADNLSLTASYLFLMLRQNHLIDKDPEIIDISEVMGQATDEAFLNALTAEERNTPNGRATAINRIYQQATFKRPAQAA